MNCECVYFNKNGTREELYKMAEKVKKWGKECEIYPLTIAKITQDIECFETVDGWGNKTRIPKGSEVLFVGGKQWNMTEARIGNKRYKPCFPTYDLIGVKFFEDIIEFEDEEE